MAPPELGRRLGTRYWTTVALMSLGSAAACALIFAGPTRPWLFSRVLLRGLVYAIAMGSLGGAIVPWVVRRLAPERSAKRWAVLIGALLAVAAAATFLAAALIGALGLAPGEPLLARFREDVRVVALLAVALGSGLSLFEALRQDLEAATAALHARELEAERAHKLALEARLASLEARLHPHFLFNSLNAISALIEEDPPRAERMVERLAALLRFALDAGRRGLVSLAEELTIVGDYLEIEKARLGDRLTYAIAVAPGLEACRLPPLAIQTLVENSVKHAIAPRPAGGRVRVEAQAADRSVIVSVWDDGPGFSLDDGAQGHGLDNLRGRLVDRFGGRAALTVEPVENGTRVTMALPPAPPAPGPA
jgi:signal transduction histidine kinase